MKDIFHKRNQMISPSSGTRSPGLITIKSPIEMVCALNIEQETKYTVITAIFINKKKVGSVQDINLNNLELSL